jgi:hypothetical protein
MFMAEQPLRGGWQQTGGILRLDDITAGHGVAPHPHA